jgi:hypothetical protein
MAYETVTGPVGTIIKLGGFNKNAEEAFPTKIKGYFVGTDTEFPTKNGPATVHTFRTSQGDQKIWGALDMDSKLALVAPGTMTVVEFIGKENLQGGKTKNRFTVSIDKSDVSDVSTSPSDEDYDIEAVLMADKKAQARSKVEAFLNRKNK